MIKSFHQRPATSIVEETHHAPEQSSRRRTIIIFLGAIAIIGWIYFFFFSDQFLIHSIEITGTQRLSRGEVERTVYADLDAECIWPTRSRNIFFIRPSELEKQLKDDLYVETVTVDKKYPDILRLKVTERKSSVIISFNGASYEIDRHGVVVRQLDVSEADSLARSANSGDHSPSVLPLITIAYASGTLSESDQFITESQMTRWLDTFNELGKRGFGYRSASLDNASSTKLDLSMFEPYHVYFDMLMSIDDQIDGYYAFMKTKKPDQPIYNYIDARIPGRIYYK